MSTLIINERIQIPYDELRFTATRSQGPGGQNVNKVNSKVIVQWNYQESPSISEAVRQRLRDARHPSSTKDGMIVLSSQRSRHRLMNQEDCLRKLRVMILDAANPPKPRKATRPTRASEQRRRRDKQLTSARKKERRGPNTDPS